MEEVKQPSFVVYELDETENMAECLGLSEKRVDELIDIVRDAHNNADRLSESADLMSRYANNATELWFMGFVYGTAVTKSRGGDPLSQLLDGLTQLKKKLDDDDNS